MLISHKHKFITIDIPKTGTRSLRETLVPLGVVDVVGGPFINKSSFYQHGSIMDANEGFKQRGWNLDDYFKFSTVRNPWRRYVSFLKFYLKKLIDHENNKKNNFDGVPERVVISGIQAEKAWLQSGRNDTAFLKKLINNWPSQHYYLVNEVGDVDFDMIAKTESLSSDVSSFCLKLGITDQLKLKHENKSVYTRSYKEYYNQELIDIVAKKEKWVIDKFGYEL
tara:strand:+ start:759 stop:1427 length:669 start_codon:yes stop_codon:yes gene_type:complete